MPNWWSRFTGRSSVPGERKTAQALMTVTSLGRRPGPAEFCGAGAGGIRQEPGGQPLRAADRQRDARAAGGRGGGRRLGEHPALTLLAAPNPRQSGGELEMVYAYLQTAGNAYLEAAAVEGEVKGLFCLRPDRMRVVAGADGWPLAYDHTTGGRTRRLRLDAGPVAAVLHIATFHPLDDHYGLSPLEAAAQSLDIHNAAGRWNKALLDNAARPSGALIYKAGGNLTEEQFTRLKTELERGYAGAMNSGRPLLLDGGLDWKPLSLTPQEMDFIELKNVAALRSRSPSACRRCCSASPATTPMPTSPRPTAPSGAARWCRWCGASRTT